MESEEEAQKYVKIVENARQVIKEKNLYLLHVPESRVLKIKDQYFIMQEKENLISGDSKSQKGIYSAFWDDDNMKDYMMTLFSQLLTFIALTKFADVKYDNIPLTLNGYVALIDLDQISIITGLTKKDGLSRKKMVYSLIFLSNIFLSF